ncbi:MAG: RDD family protein [Actinomycetota bacterium]|nr:RDD family protein [Actinomycetota bacterium]
MFSSTDEDRVSPIVPAGHRLASYGRRVGGLAVDLVVINGPVLAAFLAAGYGPDEATSGDTAIWLTIAITVVGLLYETLCVWRWGRTLGKLATGTRVVCLVTGGPLDLTRAFQRSLLPTTVSAIPQVGVFLGIGVYVTAFFDPLRQGIHDKAAGSIVVMARHSEVDGT